MQSALYAIARPSVRLSVRPCDGQSKTVELSPQSSPVPLVFAVAYKFNPEILTGSP